MKALILIADGFEDSEFFYPYYRLQEATIKVDVASCEKGTVTGKHQYTFAPNRRLDEIESEDYDILVLPGGKGPEILRLDEGAVKIVYNMFRNGKLVASICHGAQLLVSANVLKGRKATCYKAIRDDLKAAGAEYVDQSVVVDGHLVTSRHPGDLPDFCREIFKIIKVTA